ncbi:MAG: 2-oxoacid:acceptor oxidoreductase family protein [Clostridia bacterium]|nr:2-oxoacid:acceptor oxidoreductase family protein [Clostridia bacterium]
MSTTQYLFAGFGGQGILFSGKVLAYKGLTDGKNVSWLPSYGPEMRGGTASCSVIISDTAVGSPIVEKPDVLVAMNLPSLDLYEERVKSGGIIFVDSSLIDRKVKRTDVTAYYIPATKMASDNNISKLANVILLGKVLKETNGFTNEQGVIDALKKVISAKHADMLEINLNALKLGRDYKGE